MTEICSQKVVDKATNNINMQQFKTNEGESDKSAYVNE